MTHQELREIADWGTYGKNGDEPLKRILIKDISNDHLENVIIFIRDSRIGTYSMETYKLMLAEEKYRKDNNIFVPDYHLKINKPFIKGLK